MPVPSPNKGEDQSHFISRCISSLTKLDPERPMAQRQAMCYDQWRKRGTKGERGGDRGGPRKRPLKHDRGESAMDKTEQGTVDVFNMTLIDLSASKIDKENNIIRHMAILAANAYDTGNKIFRKFTDNALNDAIEIFEGALARLDHDRDNQSSVESRGVRTGYGVYQNLRREGDKIFGDLHLWDCQEARKVMSIAERTPNAVGNSIHAGGVVEDDEDGVEIVQQLLPTTTYGFKPSVDLVEDPSALIGIFQNKRKAKAKENEMEFKDLTQETIKTNRPDLEKVFFDEGAKSRDEEVKTLIQEKEAAVKKTDELEVKQAGAVREILVDKLVAESDLPDYAKTDIFRKQLLGVKESKDGDKTVSIEDGVKAIIQDRIDALEPGGVHDNDEKDMSQSKGKTKVKVNDDDFVETFSQNTDSDIL